MVTDPAQWAEFGEDDLWAAVDAGIVEISTSIVTLPGRSEAESVTMLDFYDASGTYCGAETIDGALSAIREGGLSPYTCAENRRESWRVFSAAKEIFDTEFGPE